MGETNAMSVTLQAVLFSVLSTAIAQVIAAWQKETLELRVHPYLTFAAIAMACTPPNYYYQKWLEDTFPARVQVIESSSGKSTDHLSKRNTVIKFLLDQTLGAAANTMAFVALSTLCNGGSLHHIRDGIQGDVIGMMLAGWRFWPLVTLTNLCIVPWDWRPAVGNTAGLCWGVYLNIREVMR